MSSQQTDAQTFARGSVLEYWLAHGEGFRIRPRRLRVERVEAVRVDPDSGRARSLVLRSLLHRRRTVAADEIVAVDPFERVLIVPAAGRRRRRWRLRIPVRGVALAAVGSLRPRLTAVRAATQPRLEQAAAQTRRQAAPFTAFARYALHAWYVEMRRRWLLFRLERAEGLPIGVRRRAR